MSRRSTDSPAIPASAGVEGLIREARTGDARALGQLVESCRAYLLLIANSELGSDLQAKVGASDFVQDTIVQAHQHFHEFAGEAESEFRGWVRAILLNRMLAVRRHYCETSKRDLSREISWNGDDAILGPVGSARADVETPSNCVSIWEEALVVTEAMNALPPDYRQVLVLRYWERLTFVEIGDRMGRSADAVRKLWLRAIDRLQCDEGLDRVAQ